ncbi:efflux RND transporter periplasmic adaptor subunit [Balneolales bacterium ANBcel1]|nr:efflux RND transporter periplasmic adaptor subunit [Balneolales bacterium ANBcel1]
MTLTRNQILIGVGLVLAGLLLGWILFSGTADHDHDQDGHVHTHDHEMAGSAQNGEEVWTCSMHPSVREDGPGQCPICGMDLIPASSEEREDDYSMVMTESAIQLANIQTVPVRYDTPVKEVTLPGRVKVDERRITNITTHFPGRIIEAKINFTGAVIRKGEPMATVYSPELVTAQRELLEAARQRDRNPRLYEAARQKFRLWEFSSEQIDAIIEHGGVQREMEILSPVDGIVLRRNVADEQYIAEGTIIYEVANLESLWVVLEAYEEDLGWISIGDEVSFTSRANPGDTRTATVSYIDPVVNPSSRTVGIRADIENADGRLKPDMLVSGKVRAELAEQKLMVPASSVLWTGPRSLVYIRDHSADVPRFEVREVELGPRAGDYFVIEDGVGEGEDVVFHGAFRIDSEFQLADRFSMMNREPGTGAVPVHNHGTMESRDDPATNHNGHADPADTEQDDHDLHEHGDAVDGATDDFRDDFLTLLDHYLEGKEAFVASDFEGAREAFQRTADALESVGLHRMQGDAHMRWMDQHEAIEGHLEHILGADDIEGQREGFAMLSHILIEAVHNYEIPGLLYHQYCPMVDESWLSSEEEIANPYDPNMLRCGEVVERIEH